MPTAAAPKHDARILVVIVNYRTGPLVVDCLKSLEREVALFPNAKVKVIDNHSGDFSVETIQAAITANQWAPWVEVEPSPVNGGFAHGNNLALRSLLASAETPQFVWLLNPDAQARTGALAALVDFLDEHPEVGIAGSALEERDGTPWPFTFRFPSFFTELNEGFRWGPVTRLLGDRTLLRRMDDVTPTAVDWMAGASLMIRREVFERIGLMDEGYFLYFEETDFCLQAQRAGFQCWYVPSSRVMHVAGQSTGVSTRVSRPKRMPAYWFESRARYFMKNHGRLYAGATDVVTALGFGLWRVRRALQRKYDADPPHYLYDFVRHGSLFRRNIPESRVGKST